MSQKRDERFRSALSGQSTPGVAAGVTGAEQRHAGRTHDPIVCAPNHGAMVYTARRSEMPGSLWLSAEGSAKTIHPHIRPVGSIGSAEVPTWGAIDIYDWAKPSRSPIFDVSRVHLAELICRAGLQRHDRPTVVRRYCHQTRLGVRCYR